MSAVNSTLLYLPTASLRSSPSVENLLELIEIHSDPTSPRYGCLLHWFGSPGLAWHYGIGLSDTHFFNTGPQDWRILQAADRDIQPVPGIQSPDPATVMGRLRHSLVLFESWPYDLLAWNCEHLARLVVIGDPVCEQISHFPVLGSLLSWACNGGRHPTAGSELDEWLAHHDPDLRLP